MFASLAHRGVKLVCFAVVLLVLVGYIHSSYSGFGKLAATSVRPAPSLLPTPDSSARDRSRSSARMSSLTHIVLFQFKPEVSPEKVLDVCTQMLSLKDACLSTATKKPYIKSIVGGSDNSPEGHQAGITHGFVVEFETAEDRDYYIFKDPTHIAFTKVASDVLANAIVVDFNNGSFGTARV